MEYQSFLKIYFVYIASFDYCIYKQRNLFDLKKTNFWNNFFNTNYNVLILKKKLENNLIYEFKLILILEQLFKSNFFSKNVVNNKLIYLFFDNLYIFYYKMYFYKLIKLLMLKNYLVFKFYLNYFLPEYNFLSEKFLYNFDIKLQDFNKVCFFIKLT